MPINTSAKNAIMQIGITATLYTKHYARDNGFIAAESNSSRWSFAHKSVYKSLDLHRQRQENRFP